ncbi:hypothetical protein [Marininema halotolerans]|uniref:Uncharacterized protein n=1 Tax=Marininema halotolerans TaxID=1155944 RepID=A0A1I6U2K7_9BACL|nr:hypothetical protein [Marininema halotolerans]SFS95652.1 hypothetical protein SAMN05444972_11315 [Marininema halotolerans]
MKRSLSSNLILSSTISIAIFPLYTIACLFYYSFTTNGQKDFIFKTVHVSANSNTKQLAFSFSPTYFLVIIGVFLISFIVIGLIQKILPTKPDQTNSK